MKSKETVVIIGASSKPERYSNKAQIALVADGHTVIPFNPAIREVDGIKAVNDMKDINSKVDTVTLYVGPERLKPMINSIVGLHPKRIIANPGTECDEMRRACRSAKIEYLEACTLVMISTGQF